MIVEGCKMHEYWKEGSLELHYKEVVGLSWNALNSYFKKTLSNYTNCGRRSKTVRHLWIISYMHHQFHLYTCLNFLLLFHKQYFNENKKNKLEVISEIFSSIFQCFVQPIEWLFSHQNSMSTSQLSKNVFILIYGKYPFI